MNFPALLTTIISQKFFMAFMVSKNSQSIILNFATNKIASFL